MQDARRGDSQTPVTGVCEDVNARGRRRPNRTVRAMMSGLDATPRLFLSLTTVLVACGAPQVPPAPLAAPIRTVPFYAEDDPFSPRDDRPRDFLAGLIQLGPNESRVLITQRLLRGGASEHPESIQAGLASGDLESHNWHEGQLGPARSLGHLSQSASDTLRDTLIVVLPATASERLDNQWVFFRMWGTIQLTGRTRPARAYLSFHTRPDIFRAR